MIEDMKEYQRKWYLKNKERLREERKIYRQERKEEISEKQKQYYLENRDRVKAYSKRYRQENRDKKRVADHDWYLRNRDSVLKKTGEYAKVNPNKRAAIKKRYQAKKRQAVPKWFDADAVNKVYEMAGKLRNEWGVDLVVEHIIPMDSDTVCGLHTWENLQLLDRSLNSQKWQHYNEDW